MIKILKPYKRFGLGNITQGYTDLHHAIDSVPIRKGLIPYGTPLVAPEKVTIHTIYNTLQYGDMVKDDRPITNGYGLWMQGESGYFHLYWHTQPAFPVKVGDVVLAGTIVAYVGNSGNVTIGGTYVPIDERDESPFLGTHLHQAVVNELDGSPDKGNPLNPLDFIDLATEPSYTVWDEVKAISATLRSISGQIRA